MDHCDNSLIDTEVNPFGCHEPVVLTRVEPAPPPQNSAPSLTDDQFEIETNGVLIITPEQLLANDSDADSDPLEIVDVSQPEVGRLALNSNGDLIYRSIEGYVGDDFFKYTVTDNRGGAATATATVRIKVRKTEVISLAEVQLVNFIYDEAELTEVSKTKVKAIIEQIKLAEGVIIEIYTHTDNIGSDKYNRILSAKRAKALEELLISNGIDGANITAVGVGEKKPIADNATEAGQAINRRGEFIFKTKGSAE
jgi:outer membrane protein OmpA-like peptidoglycan-associated protein